VSFCVFRGYYAALQLAVRSFSGLIPPRMSIAYQIVVCGSIVPDPLQTLELGRPEYHNSGV
jgi:hypothetical protein